MPVGGPGTNRHASVYTGGHLRCIVPIGYTSLRQDRGTASLSRPHRLSDLPERLGVPAVCGSRIPSSKPCRCTFGHHTTPRASGPECRPDGCARLQSKAVAVSAYGHLQLSTICLRPCAVWLIPLMVIPHTDGNTVDGLVAREHVVLPETLVAVEGDQVTLVCDAAVDTRRTVVQSSLDRRF